MITIMETVDKVLNNPLVLDKPDQIKAFAYLAQLGACKLELLGLKHSSGRSIINAVKQQRGFIGNKRSVVKQFIQWLIDHNYLDPKSMMADLPQKGLL